MKHLFVPYEIALKLKEKGFDESCFYAWCITVKHMIQYEGEMCLRTNGNPFGSFDSGKNWNNITGNNNNKIQCSAPLYQQVIDWLLIKNVFIQLGLNETNGVLAFYIQVVQIQSIKLFKKQSPKIGTGVGYEQFDIPTKKQAYDKAIEEAIKLI